MAIGGINQSLSSLFAQRALGNASRLQQNTLQKLSSGYKINAAKDNPAGLVISEYLRAQLGGINRSMRNNQEAYNTLSVAEGGLQEASSMLTKARDLAVHALNSGVTGSGQTSADQAELNGILNTVNRIAGTTRYADQPLLNGAQQINFTASGDTDIIDQGGTTIDIVAEGAGAVDMTFAGGAANQAEKAYVESDTVAGGALAETTTFTVQGETGEREFTFEAGTELSTVAETINNTTDQTGVTAYAVNGGEQLRLVSDNYGADASVEVTTEEGALFAGASNPDGVARDEGQNATVTVKGIEQETDGLTLEVANSAFSGSFTFNEGDTTDTTIAQTGYDQDTLTDADTAREVELGDLRGGMQLQLSDGAGAANRETFGLNPMDGARLGRTRVDGQTYSLNDLMSGGAASLAENPEAAIAVIDQAIADVAGERARIGAYQSNTLQRGINSLSVAAENVTATESSIRDASIAQQMTNFVRAQLLQQTALMGVQSSNINAENTLRLLGAG